MKTKKVEKQITAVTIRMDTYKRLVEYRKKQQLPPSIVDIVSTTIDAWLQEQEGQK